MMKLFKPFFHGSILTILAALMLSGCGNQEKSQSTQTPSDFDASGYLAKSAFPESLTVIAARQKSKNDEQVVVIGRIGGSIDPWVKGRAAFSIVDSSLKACSDETPDGEACSCETPWDYCCETDKLKDATVLVKFIDDDGKVLKQDAKTIFHLQELQTVSVQGKAQRDEAGNLTILAKKMFIQKQ